MNSERDLYLVRTIAAAHRLQNINRPEAWNRATFGKCYESIHGHSFKIEVWLRGCINPETGIIVNFGVIKNIIDRYDHKELNTYLKIPTAENFVGRLIDDFEFEFKNEDISWLKLKIRVWETENAYAEREVKSGGAE